MGAGHIFYVVVDPEGNPRLTRGKGKHFMIYSERSTAQGQCREGDAVMEMTLDLGREPLYIRSRKQEVDDGES